MYILQLVFELSNYTKDFFWASERDADLFLVVLDLLKVTTVNAIYPDKPKILPMTENQP